MNKLNSTEMANLAYDLIASYDDTFRETLGAYGVGKADYVNYLDKLYGEAAKNETITSIFGDATRIDITDYVLANRAELDLSSTGHYSEHLTDARYRYTNALSDAIDDAHRASMYEHIDVYVNRPHAEDDFTEDELDAIDAELQENKLNIMRFLMANKEQDFTIIPNRRFSPYSRYRSNAHIGIPSFAKGIIINAPDYRERFSLSVYGEDGMMDYSERSLQVFVESTRLRLHEGRRTYKSLGKLHKDIAKYLPNTERLDTLLAELQSAIHREEVNLSKGRYFISIDPRDFLTMSTNNCGWRSCLHLAGGYGYGAVQSYTHPEFLMVYKTTEDAREFQEGIHDKTWRQLYYMNETGFAQGRGYPYNDSISTDVINNYFKQYFTDLTEQYWSNDNEIHVMYDDLGGGDSPAFTNTNDDFVLLEHLTEDYFGNQFYEGGCDGQFAFQRCESCGMNEDDCECEFCNYCGDSLEICECHRCSECGEVHEIHYSDCSCDRCESCEAIVEECECSLCEECEEHEDSCTCAEN